MNSTSISQEIILFKNKYNFFYLFSNIYKLNHFKYYFACFMFLNFVFSVLFYQFKSIPVEGLEPFPLKIFCIMFFWIYFNVILFFNLFFVNRKLKYIELLKKESFKFTHKKQKIVDLLINTNILKENFINENSSKFEIFKILYNNYNEFYLDYLKEIELSSFEELSEEEKIFCFICSLNKTNTKYENISWEYFFKDENVFSDILKSSLDKAISGHKIVFYLKTLEKENLLGLVNKIVHSKSKENYINFIKEEI